MGKLILILLLSLSVYAQEDRVIDTKKILGQGQHFEIYVLCIRGYVFYVGKHSPYSITQVNEYSNGYYRALKCTEYTKGYNIEN